MSTARCTELMVRGMYHNTQEMWIAKQPFMLLTYMAVYMPWVGRQIMTNIVGPSRCKMVMEGGNMYDVKVSKRAVCM